MQITRSAGVFLHLTSLPGPHGIGDLGAGSREFLAFLERAGVDQWQICPIGPTIGATGDSPYQSYSAFAGNPLFISLDELVTAGWLDRSTLEPVPDFDPHAVEYDRVRQYKVPLLRKAFDRFESEASTADRDAFDEFRERESWLDDYVTFRAITADRPEDTWQEWPEPLRERQDDAWNVVREELAEERRYYAFRQWIFDAQWRELRSAADARGVGLIGDVPLYVSLDSADVWANPDAFQLGEDGHPTAVAGVPPNPGDDGQRWGNPLYDWQALARDEYDWWVRRIRRVLELVDAARLDHVLGFRRYWAIPAESEWAGEGEWRDGPGTDLFETLDSALGEAPFVAEDLGFEDPDVDALLHEYGIPGMSVPHYANWCREGDGHQPMHYSESTVGYTSTHDTDTWIGYYEKLGTEQRDCLHYNLGVDGGREMNWEIIDAVWGAESILAVTTMQDLLGLGSEARLNTPGTADGNWEWRVTSEALTADVADRLYELGEFHVR